MFIALTLSGIWHGSTLPFVLWGMINGLLEAGDAYFDSYAGIKRTLRIDDRSRSWRAFQIIRTAFIAIVLKTYAFKCSSLKQISALFRASIGKGAPFSIFYIRNMDIMYALIFLVIGFILLFPSIKKKLLSLNVKSPVLYDILLVIMALVSVSMIVCGSYSAFVYFQF